MYDITAHKITQVTNSGNATDPAKSSVFEGKYRIQQYTVQYTNN